MTIESVYLRMWAVTVMSETSNDIPRHPRLLDLNHIKGDATMVGGVGIVIPLDYVFSGFATVQGPPGQDFGRPVPGQDPSYSLGWRHVRLQPPAADGVALLHHR